MLFCFDANLIHSGRRDNNNEHELSLSSFVELYRVVQKKGDKNLSGDSQCKSVLDLPSLNAHSLICKGMGEVIWKDATQCNVTSLQMHSRKLISTLQNYSQAVFDQALTMNTCRLFGI